MDSTSSPQALRGEKYFMTFDYLIIGGGIAGTTAAETIRKNDDKGTIGIVSDEPYNLYSRILLSKPNFFLEVVPFDSIWLRQDEWYAQNRITLLAGKKAVNMDAGKKKVVLGDGQEIDYKKLLLAEGTRARTVDLPGISKLGVYYLRTLDDAKNIILALKESKKAAVVGGGFIGFEMSDMLKLAGKETTIIIREKHFWHPRFETAAGEIVETAMRKHGIEVILEAEVAEVKGNERVTALTLTDGREVECDMVIFGIGGYSDHEWLKSTGMVVSRGILANQHLETNLPDVWTAGDAAEYMDVILGESVQLGNWVNAQQQGRLAGQNMCGKREGFRFVSFYTTQGLDITIAFVGDTSLGENKQMVSRGGKKDSHAQIFLKLGKIIGAILINKTPEMGAIRSLIEKKVDVSNRLEELTDPEFNLKKFL